MDRFKLSIDTIENGWIDLSVSFNDEAMTLHFENIPNDPLYDLLESTIKIMNLVESTITLHNGSEKTYLSIKRLEKNYCRFEIANARIDLPVKQFCKAILRMFDTYVFTFSKEEYSNHWATFPEKELEKLRDSYHLL